MERIIANARDTIGDGDTRQATATRERIITDLGTACDDNRFERFRNKPTVIRI